MTDFAIMRRMMVDGQVRPSDVTDPRVIAAMLDVPRERFLPASRAALAYLDRDLPLDGDGSGEERRLLKPMVLARLIQALDLAEGDHVLDVGCASGYSSALLGRIVRSVVGLEEDEALLSQARAALGGEANVSLVRGPLAEGHAAGAPYDAILVNGAVESRPDALIGQLRAGGRLACIQGRGPAAKAILYRREPGEIGMRQVFDASAAVLPGFSAPAAFVF